MLSHAVSTSVRDRIDVLLMRAHGADDDTSLDLVAQALTLAESEGYVRIFVDEAPWFAAYVRRFVGRWPTGFAARDRGRDRRRARSAGVAAGPR